jgi:membrane-associated phospholipid phosphatase
MSLFYSFWKNLVGSFWKKNLIWHALAILLTTFVVLTGLDWAYYGATRSSLIRTAAFPAVALGGLLPILAPLVLLIVSALTSNLKIKYTAFTLGQAAILGALISGFYKAFTGRVPPELAHGATLVSDISRNFQFGFWRGGVFWGWPSTHTTVAFAMATSLYTIYPSKKILKIFCLLYAFYIGLGISVTIHWLSEFVAGAIFGTVIGLTVGKSFYQKFFVSEAK